MRAAVLLFPGSNCDRDVWTALAATGHAPVTVWHQETALPSCDLVVLPGGFSYGDYLRSGAMAARAPIMDAVRAHAARGGKVLGICNGFQILTEAGLLPGALMRNAGLRFVCRTVRLRIEQSTAFTRAYAPGQVIHLPVAHHDGNYTADPATLDALEQHGQIAFRYVTEGDALNPNGSARDIAGVYDAEKNVLGLMPHPERAVELLTGGTDGRGLFESLLS